MENVTKMFEELGNLGIRQEEFHENLGWDEYVAELDKYADNDKKLKQILAVKQNEEMIDDVTLEDLMKTNFANAKSIIDQMTLAKRIAVLENLQKYREHLYEATNRWGGEGIPRDEQISSADFRNLMGKIKHLEIIQNWLYGIL